MPLVAVPWTEQKKVYVPGCVKVAGKVFGGDAGLPLLWKLGLPAEVTSWKPLSQTNVTVAPTGTSTLAGSKRFPPLVISLIVVLCTGAGVGDGSGPPGSPPSDPLHAVTMSVASATEIHRACECRCMISMPVEVSQGYERQLSSVIGEPGLALSDVERTACRPPASGSTTARLRVVVTRGRQGVQHHCGSGVGCKACGTGTDGELAARLWGVRPRDWAEIVDPCDDECELLSASEEDEPTAAGRQDHQIGDQEQQIVVPPVRLLAPETGMPHEQLLLNGAQRDQHET